MPHQMQADAGLPPVARPVARPVDFDFKDVPATSWLTVTLELFDAGEMPPHLEGDVRARRLGNGQIAVVRLTGHPAS